jgi:mRNA-degrading endonuclease RelE of RelBE toxin-antitoxin system
MSYSVELSPTFKKEAKKLAKKYASFKEELAGLIELLEENPTLGIPLGNDVYKIRLAIASKGKGKSGGARVISYARLDNEIVLLLTIYNKGELDSISDDTIKGILKQYS